MEELEEFLSQVNITPALVQNEIHPYYQENDVIPYIQDLGIVVQGWYPLGGRGHTGELLGDEVITEIAKGHDVSSAQVILRWNLQKGVVVIPGSSNPDHIKENTELFHFELTDEEMERINALDRARNTIGIEGVGEVIQKILAAILLLFVLSACASQPEPAITAPSPAATPDAEASATENTETPSPPRSKLLPQQKPVKTHPTLNPIPRRKPK